jgi:hypothetical protein
LSYGLYSSWAHKLGYGNYDSGGRMGIMEGLAVVEESNDEMNLVTKRKLPVS